MNRKSTTIFGKEFELRQVDMKDPCNPSDISYWFKTSHALPDDPTLHRAVLAYISDFGLLRSTVVPHEKGGTEEVSKRRYRMASLDHCIWFHRDFKVDNWLLYSCTPISTSGGRGLALGRVYNQEGALVATTTQEGVLRIRRAD